MKNDTEKAIPMSPGRIKRREQLAERRQQFESTPEEERIADFINNNPPDKQRTVEEWMEIHRKLTGSCGIGGDRFIRDKGFKRYEKYSTLDFLKEVGSAYSGELIEKLKMHYSKEEN